MLNEDIIKNTNNKQSSKILLPIQTTAPVKFNSQMHEE